MASPYSGGRPKVRVIARTKPTANFPQDVIGIGEDGKVIKAMQSTLLTSLCLKHALTLALIDT